MYDYDLRFSTDAGQARMAGGASHTDDAVVAGIAGSGDPSTSDAAAFAMVGAEASQAPISPSKTGLIDLAEERSALRRKQVDLDAQEARIAEEWRAIQTEWDIIGAEWAAIVVARRELDDAADGEA